MHVLKLRQKEDVIAMRETAASVKNMAMGGSNGCCSTLLCCRSHSG